MAKNDNDSGSKNKKGKERDMSANDIGAPMDGEPVPEGASNYFPGTRIAASAAALSSAALFGRPESSNLRQLTAIDKLEESRASSASGLPTEGRDISHQHSLRQGRANAALESMHSRKHVEGKDPQYSAFLADHQSADGAWLQSSVDSLMRDASGGQRTLPPSTQSQSDISAVAQQESRDGHDLVKLLSGPDSQSEDEILTDLSPEETSALRKALFGNGNTTHQVSVVMNWDNLLNFQPGFLRGDGDNYGAQEHLGEQDITNARRMWLTGWKTVLTSYADEVWGELGSVASEARKEVDESQKLDPNIQVSDLTALRRLRLILAHVRGD